LGTVYAPAAGPGTFSYVSGPSTFERDAYQWELATDVVRSGEHQGRPYAVLADTVLYPEIGGQGEREATTSTFKTSSVYEKAPASAGARELANRAT
jgi:hypothetical protein